MKTESNPVSTPQPAQKSAKPVVPLSERAAYSPAEFAGLFGRKKTWTYRQLYAQRLKAITTLGQLMIPRSEAERLLAGATVFNGDPKRSPKARGKKTEAGQPA